MKIYFSCFFALALSLPISTHLKSATATSEARKTVVYLIYNSGAQNLISSYTQSDTGHNCPPPATRLCHIMVTDPDGSGIISQAEFTSVFNALDTDSDNSLDDQTASAILRKRP